MTDLTFPAPVRALSVNEKVHWGARERRLKPWRDAAWAAARNAIVTRRLTTGVPVTVQVVIPFRGHQRRDAHNFTGTNVKAVVDALVTAGVVPDDTPEWVTVVDSELVVQNDKSEPLTATVRIHPRETP